MGGERLTEKQGRQRLLDAAVELALEVGGPDFTVRQVAARAGLNHGLVHRYFGTKDSLTSAVIRQIGAELADSPGPVSLVNDHRGQVLALLLAHSSAAHHLDDELASGIRPMVDMLGTSASDPGGGTLGDARIRAALRLATILGWVSNEELIISVCQLGRDQLAELMLTIDS